MRAYYNMQVDCAITLLLTLILVHGRLKLNTRSHTNCLFYRILITFILLVAIDFLLSFTKNSSLIMTSMIYLRNIFISIIAFFWFNFIFRFMSREYNLSLKRFANLSLKESMNTLGKNHFVILMVLSLTILFCTISKILYKRNILSFIVMSISVTLCYLMLIDYEMTHDAVTKVQNRFAFEKFILRISNYKNTKKTNTKVTVVNIDLDDFKCINDTYGHKEGDKALRMFCKLLLNIIPMNCIFRYGGDEFILIINSTDEFVPQKLINRLISYVNQFNLTKMKPYELKFSYGISTQSLENINIHNILIKCDNLMYEQKKCKKIAR